jgi:glycosyltransferase involved in cell wall biosynthesis
MEKPITGVYLIDSLVSGGAQRQLVELVKNIDKTIINPIVVVYHDLPFYLDELNQCGIETILLSKKDKLGITFMTQFVRFLQRVRPEFIHSFLNVPNFYARLAKLTGTVKIVITSERNISLVNSWFLKWLERLTWRFSNCIIANAEAIKGILIEQIGIPSCRIFIVNNGLVVEHFSKFDSLKVSKIKDKMQVRCNGEYLIGLIGRIAPQKNHGALIDAISLIKRDHAEILIKLGFWGGETDIGYAKELKSKCLKVFSEDGVFFWGPEKDMASVYAACDLIVLPSLFEGFPNVVIEAMAAGRIIIASDVADNARIIEEGVTGFLVSPHSPEMLAERILAVLLMPDEDKAKIGERARKQVLQRYSVETMVNNTMAVYANLNLC